MKIENYVIELLYNYECITIPNFGGFVRVLNTAQFENGRISLTTYAIRFNQKLDHNDGLLINYVAGKSGLNYNEAKKNIENTVDNWYTKLDLKNELLIENLGVIKRDNQQLLFTPISDLNFNKNTYGLPVLLDLKEENNSFLHQAKKYIAVAAVLVPLISLGIYSYQNKNAMYPYFAQSGIVDTAVLIESSKEVTAENNAVVESDEEVIILVEETVNSNLKVEKSKVEKEKKRLNERILAEEKAKLEKENTHRYKVVVGAFSKRRNANKMLRNLKQKGYDRAKFIHRKNIVIVTIDSFKDEQNALDLKRVLSEDYPGVWIKK